MGEMPSHLRRMLQILAEVSQGQRPGPARAMTHWDDVFYLGAVGLCAALTKQAHSHREAL